MTTLATTKLVTSDEFLEMEEPQRGELIRGRVVEMVAPGGTHGRLAMRLARFIGNYAEEHALGEVFAAETGFVLERNPDTVRCPDVAFIARGRLAEAMTDKHIPIPPDLVVEVNSPNDRAGEVLAKVRWWLSRGVRLVWVVDPESETVMAYLPDGAVRLVRREETLDGGDVLPGFEVALGRLFGG